MRFVTQIAAVMLGVMLAGVAGWPSQATAGKPGESGFLSLRLPVGARETGMGSAGVASSQGAASIYWNAAILPYLDYKTDLLLQHQRWLSLFNRETAYLAHRTKFGDLGFIFQGFYSDEITRYDDEEVGIPKGTFRPYDVVFGLAYATRIVESFSAGATVKFLHEEIDVYSDSGFAVDLFLYHQAIIEGLSFGAALTNLGSDIKLNQEPFPLPTAFRIGAAYAPPEVFLLGYWTFAADVIVPNDGTEKAHVGLEWHLIPELALRFGSNLNYDSRGLTFGAGFRKGVIGIGYAFEDMKESNGLETGHMFTLSLHY
jgi:hypothetical protein